MVETSWMRCWYPGATCTEGTETPSEVRLALTALPTDANTVNSPDTPDTTRLNPAPASVWTWPRRPFTSPVTSLANFTYQGAFSAAISAFVLPLSPCLPARPPDGAVGAAEADVDG